MKIAKATKTKKRYNSAQEAAEWWANIIRRNFEDLKKTNATLYSEYKDTMREENFEKFRVEMKDLLSEELKTKGSTFIFSNGKPEGILSAALEKSDMKIGKQWARKVFPNKYMVISKDDIKFFGVRGEETLYSSRAQFNANLAKESSKSERTL